MDLFTPIDLTAKQMKHTKKFVENLDSLFNLLRVLRATNLCFICVHLWLKFPPDEIRAHPERFTDARAKASG
jgi:hypothetical protein